MISNIKIEVCANSVDSCIAAEKGGADRVELCDNLLEGGTTPSAAAVKIARRKLNIDLNVIIRPRGGDFLYNDTEFDIMLEDVRMMKDLGADGIVIGLLNPDGTIDRKRTAKLIQAADNLSVTFHRAFDMCKDPIESLEVLIDLGIDRILSSGLQNKAQEGSTLLAELVSRARDQIIIMPGSGIKAINIQELVKNTQAKEYHVSCRSIYPGGMTFRRAGISMGGHPNLSEFDLAITDPEKIKEVVANANKAWEEIKQSH